MLLIQAPLLYTLCHPEWLCYAERIMPQHQSHLIGWARAPSPWGRVCWAHSLSYIRANFCLKMCFYTWACFCRTHIHKHSQMSS